MVFTIGFFICEMCPTIGHRMKENDDCGWDAVFGAASRFLFFVKNRQVDIVTFCNILFAIRHVS